MAANESCRLYHDAGKVPRLKQFLLKCRLEDFHDS
jgi:hypothetical protein